MLDAVKALVWRFAKVPAEPHVPAGSPESVRVFRPGKNYLYIRLVLWAVINGVALLPLAIFFLAGALNPRLPDAVRTIWVALAGSALMVFAVSLPVTLLIQILNYEMRWYIVTDQTLRIRTGIVFVKELTMTFANIQDIRVRANPLERLLGLANVVARSAGGGANENGIHTGHMGSFQGLDNASAIRDLIRERLRIYKDSGLGERTESERAHEGGGTGAVEAARELLEETRALRRAITISDRT